MHPTLPTAASSDARTCQERRAVVGARWATLWAVAGGGIVTAYFFLGAAVATFTIEGDPDPEQIRQSHQLVAAGELMGLTTLLLTLVVRRMARSRGLGAQPGSSRLLMMLVITALAWPAGFVVSLRTTQLWPADLRPLLFGAGWAFGGVVVGPMVAAIADRLGLGGQVAGAVPT